MLSYLLKFRLLANPKFLTIVIPTVVVAVADDKDALRILIIAMLLDFVTGILASWNEAKKAREPFKITSHKLRRSLIKTITYFAVIYFVYEITMILHIKNFHFDSFDTLDFTPTFVTIGVCAAVEIWSIFMENLPRAGYDIVGSIRALFTGISKLKQEIKNETDKKL